MAYKRRLRLQGLRRAPSGALTPRHGGSRLPRLFKLALQLCGLYGRGYQNFIHPEVVKCDWFLPGLPPAFNGFRVLQLSDLHAGFEPVVTERVISEMRSLEYDICVNTGDFQCCGEGGMDKGLKALKALAQEVNRPHFGVPGNHDRMEDIVALEAMGMRMLVNENVPIDFGGERIWLAGVDDAYYYTAADPAAACRGIAEGAFSILLSHSPQIHREAAAAGFAWMLSGHTHGGQICLPGGHALFSHCRVARAYASGAWKSSAMQGYTARGSGGAGLPVRFNCPPEITLHQLHNAG